jgi:hypothetical protein
MSSGMDRPIPHSLDGWTWPKQVRSFFVTAGAADPTVFSGDIQSVTRVNSGGGNPLYRVLYKTARPNRSPCDEVSVMCVDADRIEARIITGEAGVDYQRNVDVQMATVLAAGDRTLSNSIASGRRVVLSLWDEGFNAS